MTDFHLSGGGTLYGLLPLTEAANNWVDEFLSEDAPRLGQTIGIEHRFVDPIIDEIIADGLTINL